MMLSWTFAPSVLIGFCVWTAAYIYLTGRLRSVYNWGPPAPKWQQIAFHAATLAATLALISPIDRLGDEFLFSAHMVQHLLLIFVSAPLWLIGTPGWLIRALVPERIALLARWMTRPVVAFSLFALAMSVWHLPALYNLTLEEEWLHIAEHLIYMAAAVIGWWPVSGPETEIAPRPAPPMRMLYIFFLAMPCTAVAAVLTFAKVPLYPYYATAPRITDLSVLADQQLGGLLMWLPSHMILLLAFSVTFFRWFNTLGQGSEEPLSVNPSS